MDSRDLESMGITKEKVDSSTFSKLLSAKNRQEFINTVNGSSSAKNALRCSKLYAEDFRRKYGSVYYKLKG